MLSLSLIQLIHNFILFLKTYFKLHNSSGCRGIIKSKQWVTHAYFCLLHVGERHRNQITSNGACSVFLYKFWWSSLSSCWLILLIPCWPPPQQAKPHLYVFFVFNLLCAKPAISPSPVPEQWSVAATAPVADLHSCCEIVEIYWWDRHTGLGTKTQTKEILTLNIREWQEQHMGNRKTDVLGFRSKS